MFAQQNEFLTKIEEMEKRRVEQMFKNVLHVRKETGRAILQQSNAHLN